MPKRELPIFRASSLQRLMACPASGAMPQVTGESSGYAEAGTAGHAFLERLAKGADVEEALAAVPQEHREMCKRIDLDAIEFANSRAEQSFHWRSDIGTKAGAETEALFSVTGTTDQLTMRDSVLTVTDWKFGRPEFTHPARGNKQLMFYGMAAMSEWGAEKLVLRLGFIDQDSGRVHYDIHEPSPVEVRLFKDELSMALIRRVVAAEDLEMGHLPNLTEGDHCFFCPARTQCPAKVALIQQFAQGLVLKHPAGEITPAGIGASWVKVQKIKKAIADFEASIAGWVKTNGEVPLPSGKVLGVIKRKGNEKLDPHVAMDCLVDVVGLDLATEAVTMSVTKKAILEAVKSAGLKNRDADKVVKAIRDAKGVKRNKDSERVGEKKA